MSSEPTPSRLRPSSSLLERIRLQQEQMRQEQDNQQAQRQANMEYDDQVSAEAGEGIFAQAWNALGTSEPQEDDDTGDHYEPLLEVDETLSEEYSMQEYFVTFLHDFRKGFLALPLAGRLLLVLVLLWIIWKVFP